MSAVFEVSHLLTGSKFAIKWLLPEIAAREDGVRRFVREAKVAGRFKHPNVVEVYDFCEAADSFYMVMELLEGESLDTRLSREGKLSAAEACRILVPCMRAVGRAHAAGVIHRDLKPGNIFICAATEERPELPKVLDFGISRVTEFGVRSDSPITETGMWMGTPHYMSPEQVRNRPIDHRADVYAFGVILYEVLSGELPFDSDSLSALMVKVAVENPTPLQEVVPDIDPGLAEVVHRALARAPAARFQDMESMVRALLPYLPADAQRGEAQLVAAGPEPAVAAPASIESTAEKPTLVEKPAPVERARTRWMPAVLALGLAAAAALSFWLISAEQPAPGKRVVAAPEKKSDAPAPASPPAAATSTPLARTADDPPAPAPSQPSPGDAPIAAAPQDARPAEGASAVAGSKRAARTTAPERSKPGPEPAERAPAPPARAKPSSLSGKPSSLSGVSFDLDDFMPRAKAQEQPPLANRRP